MEDAEFPEPRPGPSWERLRLRAACSAVVAVCQLVVFRDFLAGALPFLWPPMEPITQWLTFIMVSLGSFVVISGLFGTLIADRLYDRYLAEP
jgi:hypothetical protein